MVEGLDSALAVEAERGEQDQQHPRHDEEYGEQPEVRQARDLLVVVRSPASS